MSAGFINNTKHFAIANASTLIQDALNAGRLENPYVALVDGDLDYNSLTPACYIGEWSDNGEGTYTFQILDTGNTAWEDGINIGSLLDVYFNGGQDAIDMDVTLSTIPGSGEWNMTFVEPEESANPSYTFETGSSETWTCGEIMTSPSESEGIRITWNGTDSFELQSSTGVPLSMGTINPECE